MIIMLLDLILLLIDELGKIMLDFMTILVVNYNNINRR